MTKKLNIEELAREAGFKSRDGAIRTVHSNGSFVVINEELEAFARLIVKRCAQEGCDSLTRGRSPHGPVVAAAIRNLLED